MTNVTALIADSTWAILTYEEAWKSYINSYVIAKNNAFVLIDSHLRKHRSYFQQALAEIGVKPEQIGYVYFTHRHADHIGNADLFPSRHNWIHLDDYYELDDFSQTLFGHTFTGTGGDLPLLQFRQLPFHTAGSVAFFDPETKVCFIGDHLSFFAKPMQRVVDYGADLRESWRQFLLRWKEQEPEKAAGMAEGLEMLLSWPIEQLATGHGTVLSGDIAPFLQELIALARQP
ncbi:MULTISPECIES: MBL fold metallo-hydrolase [Brevibacillus]|uniref:Anti-Pycsar protein Apyc1 n=1 Tax=Brevibacillus aydinogluensis TaxID=927786 RepID=A0AA48MCN3_9BACL|nr:MULTISPECIES: MBL fold metallo-hydrolase [Brevibacillus]REK61470.1 MAG: flavoprotein [Brevibacillus sp.]MBR8660334.1 MBL fold metallo-hydrolase [Brevibacillus sp. NL20B1]MDT3416504.1 glyoxylase-like metal-dependent hydrolase (beta-lactamase superfamily II) [Brevibacillus aydinogluensis]NNV03553.1 MBL fold metallo-hydrolase [Brevibacillus sp. MCWH]CAJ1003145.1 Anti-Pycsar protein Apyc1 [Brevibacillus aydinogluensis]